MQVRDPVPALVEVRVVVVPAMAGAAGVRELGVRAGAMLTVAAFVSSVTLLRGAGPLAVAAAVVGGGALGLLAGTVIGALARVGSIRGGDGSIARRVPAIRRATLRVSQGQISLTEVEPGARRARLLWTLDRRRVAGVERRPRLQQLARFRLHFEDGSWIALMTPAGADVRTLVRVLGRPGAPGAPPRSG